MTIPSINDSIELIKRIYKLIQNRYSSLKITITKQDGKFYYDNQGFSSSNRTKNSKLDYYEYCLTLHINNCSSINKGIRSLSVNIYDNNSKNILFKKPVYDEKTTKIYGGLIIKDELEVYNVEPNSIKVLKISFVIKREEIKAILGKNTSFELEYIDSANKSKIIKINNGKIEEPELKK